MPDDGQHRNSGGGAPNNGQRMPTGGYVGQKSGGEQQMSVPKPAKDADISTTTMSGGPLSPGEKGGADDKR